MKQYTPSEINTLMDYEKGILAFMKTDEYIKLPMREQNRFGAELINLGYALYFDAAPAERRKQMRSALSWDKMAIGESTTTAIRLQNSIHSCAKHRGFKVKTKTENGRLIVTRIA